MTFVKREFIPGELLINAYPLGNNELATADIVIVISKHKDLPNCYWILIQEGGEIVSSPIVYLGSRGWLSTFKTVTR